MRQRRLTLVGVVALLAAIVLAAGVIASTGGNGTPRVEAPVTTTLPLIHVGPGTTIPTAPVYNGPTPIGLAFVSPTEGWLCARSNMEYTQDAGTNWYNVRVRVGAPASPRFQFPVCAAVPGGNAWMVTTASDGDGLVVVHVSGRGRGDDTWKFPALPDDWTVRDLAFSDPLHGWAFALDRAGAATAMFVTDDGGATWNDAKPVRRATLFATATEGWAVPDISPGELTHTLDGGRTWERLSEPFYGAELRPIAARGADVVALVTGTDGERPSFEVSTDDGNSWREVRGPATIGAGPFVATRRRRRPLADRRRQPALHDGRPGKGLDPGRRVRGDLRDHRHPLPHAARSGFVAATGAGAASSGTVVLQTTDGGDTWTPVAGDAPPLASETSAFDIPGGIFGCPTHPLAPAPPGNPPLGLIAAAVDNIETTRGWTPVGNPIAYRVGTEPSEHNTYAVIFNAQIPSCGSDTVAASWVVELQGAPGSGGGGSTPQAQIVLANSPDGWRVYGRYH